MAILENLKGIFKYREKDESLKDNIKKHVGPIISYFGYKRILDDEKTPDYMKKGIQNLMDMTEKECYENLEKIKEILKKH